MRSRILQYKNNLADYDLLTQFSIKNHNSMPTFSSLNVRVKNIQTSDIKQVCLNLISIQLVGNNHVVFSSQKDVSNLILKCNGINTYFILENLSLLGYKNNLKSDKNNKLTVHGKNFLNIIEYFASNSNFLKSLEKTSNKHLSIAFSYQLANSKNNEIALYFLKSLGFPL
ncbi:hypothetical protein [Mucilaginibacter boryungensis]|uniref:Uncharacterized protein n=2 Tax=Pyropia yezoensis TaxID=2788 RepID=I0B721_PYRYE|nr:hypothetical protein PyyeM_p22 [Neopyropia yezoensis]AFH57689.1 hypothetical protein [Neopyropia yezoensis]AGZ17882.1 hypothetical protein [Neopyropia yezoensis]QGA30561.1 hypothetical protein PyyeMp22 [Neopyropia yezoensis]